MQIWLDTTRHGRYTLTFRTAFSRGNQEAKTGSDESARGTVQKFQLNSKINSDREICEFLANSPSTLPNNNAAAGVKQVATDLNQGESDQLIGHGNLSGPINLKMFKLFKGHAHPRAFFPFLPSSLPPFHSTN